MNSLAADAGFVTEAGLWNRLFDSRTDHGLHSWDGSTPQTSSWDSVRSRAEHIAGCLRREHPDNAPVATVLTNSETSVAGLLAIWASGHAVASLPLPARGVSPQAYGHILLNAMSHLGTDRCFVDAAWAPLLAEALGGGCRVISWEELESRSAGPSTPSPPGPSDVAFVQFSSGSTSRPKGCTLSSTAITRQLDMILAMSGGVPRRERVVSWLPLSHDMGMFGCLLYSLAHDFPLVMSSPERFATSPRTWFSDAAEHAATMTAGSSLALRLAGRAHRGRRLPKDLALRVCVLGGDQVSPAAIDDAVAALTGVGLTAPVLMPAYGMAESTLAVSATAHDHAPHYLHINRKAVATDRVEVVSAEHPHAMTLVSNGRPLPGAAVRVSGGQDIGELIVTSPSLCDGYYNDPARTRESFVGGAFRSSDIGFVHEGEVYVLGRSDDMMSVGGRKVHARDIEAVLDELAALRPGCSVLVEGADDGEFVLIAEPRSTAVETQSLFAQIGDRVMHTAGLGLTHIVLVARGSIPKTPSGKVQRTRTRDLLLDGRLPVIARMMS